MLLRTPISTRTAPTFPYTTLFRSPVARRTAQAAPEGIRHHARPGGTGRRGALVPGQHLLQQPDQRPERAQRRSEEHTYELQSLMRISYAVFCLQNKKHSTTYTPTHKS